MQQAITLESPSYQEEVEPQSKVGRILSWLPFAITIFVSAFLLFQVQLIISKYILPWFGGTPAVWTTCMLFFQLLLLAGYAYSHLLISRASPRMQRTFQIAILLSALLVVAYLGAHWGAPILPSAAWKPHAADNPVWLILKLLAVGVGLPFFLLSTTGPLLQAWFARTNPGVSPYRLYALSNLGSLLGLLSYPVLVEPSLTLRHQASTWFAGYCVFTVCCAICAWKIGNTREAPTQAANVVSIDIAAPRPSGKLRLTWLALAACASVMLIATTNQICQEVAVIPFLWVLPLSIYLLSFIICFEKEHWYSRRIYVPLLAVATIASSFALFRSLDANMLVQIGIYAFVLFACCMLCHGELVRLKPSPRYLTSFYLMVSSGGALGGIFVGLIAPHIFRAYWEFSLGLWITTALLTALVLRENDAVLIRYSPWAPFAYIVALGSTTIFALRFAPGIASAHKPNAWVSSLVGVLAVGILARLVQNRRASHPRIARYAVTAAIVFFAIILISAARGYLRNTVSLSRNFYGVLSVLDRNANDPEEHFTSLRHGKVLHGFQFVSPAKRGLPTSYFTEQSGIGLTLLNHPKRVDGGPNLGGLRIGVVGLGVGTIAAYGRPGDYLRFYEINPTVVDDAFGPHSYFSYLKDCQAHVEIALGDARISMERELEQNQSQRFDVLVVDAFSSDSIPVHLLTKEAFDIYLQEMQSRDSILAIHISNRALDLEPVVRRLAREVGLTPIVVSTGGSPPRVMASKWMLLTANQRFLQSPAIISAALPANEAPSEARLWTDEYSNLFQLLAK